MHTRLKCGWLSPSFLALALLYFLPVLWGWHAVPFHLLSEKYTGSACTRALPEDLRHLPGDDATGVIMDYPDEYYTAQRVRKLDMPWWNPQIGMGRPWIGNAQVHPFSPLLLPFLAWPAPWTYTLQFVLGSLVCLWGARRFLGLLGVEPLAAALGAALWTFNPFTTASMIMSSVWAYWWSPWLFAGIALAVRGGRLEGWALAAAAGALMLLSGQPETALLLAEMAALFGLFLAIGQGRSGLKPKRWLAGVLLGAALGLLLSAGQWYPVLEILTGSDWYKSAGPEHARVLTHPVEEFFRPGSLVFLLPVSLASWVLLLRKGNRWAAAAWGTVLLFGLAFSVPPVAQSLPFHLLRLRGIVPPLHGAELACVPAAVTAALGFSALLKGDTDPVPRALRISACLLAFLLLAGGLWTWGSYQAGGWTPVLWLGAGTATFCLAALVSGKRWTAPLLFAAAVLSATFPLARQRFTYPYFSGCPQPDWRAFSEEGAPRAPDAPPARLWAQASPRTSAPYLMPNLGLLSGAHDVRSSMVLNPPGSRSFSHAWGAGGYLSHLTYGFGAATPGLLEFLGVSRVLLWDPAASSGFRRLALEDGPRAFVAPGVEGLPDDAACVARFKELLGQDRLHEVAVVLGEVPGGGPHQGGQSSAVHGAPVTWLEYAPERLALRAEAPAGGLLVVTEAFNPLWQASVDGQTAHLVRADVMFRGVFLEPGTHRVEMSYRAGRMGVSLAVSAVTWVGLLCWVIGRRR